MPKKECYNWNIHWPLGEVTGKLIIVKSWLKGDPGFNFLCTVVLFTKFEIDKKTTPKQEWGQISFFQFIVEYVFWFWSVGKGKKYKIWTWV